ncbi:EcsC family protein [Heyndrickxia camelliae]|uniref:ABC transporter substrate-binding protein n=1 Tax=Heyndrickxia camelliae TaxID=1707093 RepID=A0A2N3LIE6_9BACI|nr:EcsC family protein [Heyndrickxia camelliae]PKR84303.1 ABC transporter substrate-binding protein [Heyndrickxia camelliae]
MSWTNNERKVWEDIEHWIQSFQTYEENDFQNLYGKWVDKAVSAIPESLTEPFFEKLDTWLFHLHSLLQGMQIQEEARERILKSAKAFDDSILSIEDMKKLSIDQLSYIADQHVSRHKVYSLLQGGMTATGQPIFVSSDFLALVLINLRSVQLTAITYGYDVRKPFEMMTALKVFHAASLPNRLRGSGWDNLTNDLEEQHSLYFYEGMEKVMDYRWLEEPFKQLMKVFFISLFNKKASKSSFVSLALGAGINYQFSRKVNQFAEKYYQYRFLLDKRND